MKNTFNLAFSIGESLKARSFRLQSQQIEIQGVTVDNANSDLPVLLYGGTSPNGTPYYVAPGRSISIAFAGHNAIYAQFHLPDHVEHKSKTGGTIYISVSSEPNELFTAGTVSIAGPVEITGVELPPIDTGVYPPSNAIRPIMDFFTNVNMLTITSAEDSGGQRHTILDGPGPTVTPEDDAGFCVTAIILQHFNLQPWLEWEFQSRATFGGYRTIDRGYGDKVYIYPLPYMQIPSRLCFLGIYFRIVNYQAIMGTFRPAFWLGGFYQPGAGHGIERPEQDPQPQPIGVKNEQRNATKTRRRSAPGPNKTKSTQRPSRAG